MVSLLYYEEHDAGVGHLRSFKVLDSLKALELRIDCFFVWKVDSKKFCCITKYGSKTIMFVYQSSNKD